VLDEAAMKIKKALKALWESDARLTALGVVMIALLAATGVALVLDPRQITGAPAWLKPAKFSISIAIYALTLAWVFTYLPDWPRTRRVVSWITTVTLLLEIVIIDVQAWRGTTSHFNVGTLMDGILFTIMGLAIVVQTSAAISVAVALWRQRFSDRAFGWALRFGMTITIVGALTGGLMTQPTRAQMDNARAGNRMTVSGAHTVGAPDGGPGLPGTGWSREHGDIRVAHFLGLHALQMLPLAAFLFVRRGWQEMRRVRMVCAIAASYVSLFSLLLWQALRGQSVTAPDGMTIAGLTLWAALTALAMWAAASRAMPARVQALV
jgi:energy-converting hydrogenase Eha subunit F